MNTAIVETFIVPLVKIEIYLQNFVFKMILNLVGIYLLVDQGIKEVEALGVLNPEKNQKLKLIEGRFPKEMRTNEIKNEIDEIKKWEDKIKRKNLKYETSKYIDDFQ